MSNDSPTVQVRFTDGFLRQVRALAKRYRQIQADIQPVIQQLEAGSFPLAIASQEPGTPYSKCGSKTAMFRKAKAQAIDCFISESPSNVLLLLIYSKSDQTDVAAAEIRSVIAEFYGEDDTSS